MTGIITENVLYTLKNIYLSVCTTDLCLQRVTIPSRLLDVNVNDLPSLSDPPRLFTSASLGLLFSPLRLLKLMTWLLISPV